MRSRLIGLIALAIAVLGLTAVCRAQTPATVTLTASHLTLGDGVTPLPVGDEVCALTTDQNDNPMSYRVGASSGVTTASGATPGCATLTTAGTVPSGFSILNSAASAPGPACIRITEVDATQGEVNRLVCVQTGTAAALTTWCSIASGVETCDLDDYQPNYATPATIVPQPGSISGLNITGNLAVTGTIDTAAAPGTVFSSSRFAQASQVSASTYTISQANCGDILQFGYSGGATVTLPTITTLSTNCFFHVYATTATHLASGSANIFYPQDTGAEVSSYTLAAQTDADVVAIQGFGYVVTGVAVVQLGVANTFSAAQTFSGGVNTSAAPGTVYSTNRGWGNPAIVSSASPSITSADCGRVDYLTYSGAVSITMPTITTLPANCSLNFALSTATTLALASGSANIGSAATGFVATFPTLYGPQSVEVDAFQGFGYLVMSALDLLDSANTFAMPQTLAAGATLGSTITVPPMESVVTGGIDLAGPVAGGAPTLPVFPGGTFIGDSATGGYSPGCTPVPVYGWCTTGFAWLMAPDLGGFPTVQGAAGDTSVDMLREWMLPYIAAYPVQDQRMPLKMGSSGGDDALGCSGCTARFVSTMRTALVLSAIPASHVTFGQASGVTQTGTWAADNFPSLGAYNGAGPQPAVSGMAIASSAASSTLTFPVTTTNNNQGVYCGWRVFTTAVSGGYSSGAASFAIGGTSITDTWSALLGTGTGHNTLDSVFSQQYIVPAAGTYTVTVTVTTAPFSFVYCAVAPQTLYEVGQPAAVFANVAHQLPAYGGASDSVTGAYTTAMNGLVAQLQGDNLAVAVADVWDYLLPADINHVDGVHPTVAGYQHGRDAFEFAILQLSQRSMLNAGVLRGCGTFTSTAASQAFACAQATPQSHCATAALNASGSSVYITAKAAQSITVASAIGAQFDLSCSAN